MIRIDKTMFRAAQRIGDQLAQRRCDPNAIALPQAQWTEAVRLAGSVELAQRQGWALAGSRRRRDLIEELDQLQRSLSLIAERLQDHSRQKQPPSDGELYRDLAALAEEFPAVEFDMDALELSVVTPPIVLEGITLGRFDIRLSCEQFSAPSYSVNALDPNPAATNSDVTHPHVNDGQLCEGDGRRGIASALADGRIYDFYSIVHQTLQTYAPGRAYVELDMWDGFSCHDCGDSMHADDCCTCSDCEQTICLDCSRCCSRCDEAYCWNCCGACSGCEETVCPSCLERCRGCGNRACPDCLTDNLCSECLNNEEETDEAECSMEETEANTAPDSAVHADRVGEVAAFS